MQRLTVSLESPEYEALVEEAEKRDVSKSTVAREVFSAWRDNSLTTPSPDADESSSDTHNEFTASSPGVHSDGDGCAAARDAQKHVEELEQRVAQLEKTSGDRRRRRARRDSRRRDPDSDDDSDDDRRRRQPSTTDRGRRRESVGRRDSDASEARTKRPLPEDVDKAISEWNPPGTGRKARTRTTTLRVIVEYLREHGSAKKNDLVTNIYDTGRHQADYGTSDGWYNALAKGVGGQTGGLAYVAEQTDRVVAPGDPRDSWQWVETQS